jgi:hypothetical protein
MCGCVGPQNAQTVWATWRQPLTGLRTNTVSGGPVSRRVPRAPAERVPRAPAAARYLTEPPKGTYINHGYRVDPTRSSQGTCDI